MRHDHPVVPRPPSPAELPALVLDSLNAGVYVTDTDRRIVYWNQAAERITGWQSQHILGKSCSDQVLCHVDKDDRPLCGHEFCPLHRAIITGAPSRVPSVVFALSATGERVPMRVSVAPLRAADGRIVGGVETFFDMSGEIGDLQRAQRIQSQCLLNEAVGDSRLAVQLHYAPCDMIGGDFAAISRTGPDRYAFIVADVTGHGLSAALFTMYLRSLWDEQCELESPAAILGALNRRLAGVMSSGGKFATAVCGVMDLGRGMLSLASAGGPVPLLARGKTVRPCADLAGLPMGLQDSDDYEHIQIPLQFGDGVLLFSDGAVEIHNRENQELGTEGLIRLLKEIDYPSQALSVSALEDRMLAYSNAICFADDVTIMEILLRNGS